MKRLDAFQRCVLRSAGAGLLFSMWLPTAWAEEVSIQASFKPDSGNPQRNQFKNDTPPSGYCESYPDECLANRVFSLRVLFNGLLLNERESTEVVSLTDAAPGKRVLLEILPTPPADGVYKPGSYFGSVNRVFNAVLPGA
ncbi:hypothetical protein [Pseudomonas sp. TH41]|uniref:hypothetical protein n=1 Tax=Pseudomonas sp. TH41 TaxID=2796405 RepID=UPI001F5B13E2|nr:hypothetical protein [Pseudomonas sp. TH41]